MTPPTIVFLHWLLSLIGLFASAAAGLPFITALSMIIGRRGNAEFCIQGSIKLLGLAQVLAIFGIIYSPLSLFILLLPYGPSANIQAALFSSAGASYISCFSVWVLGTILIYFTIKALKKTGSALHEDRYVFAFIKKPFILCMASAACFFSAHILINFPFAGIPSDLTWDRVIMAFMRSNARHYFTTFCPAGAIALVFAQKWFISGELSKYYNLYMKANVWLALWAAAGYFPYLVVAWGTVLGITLSNAPAASLALDLTTQIMTLCFLTFSIICWLWIVLGKSYVATLSWIGLLSLLFKESSPFIVKLYSLAF